VTSALAAAQAPVIDWAGLSPLLALLGAAIVVLLGGLLRPRGVRAHAVPALTVLGFAAAIVCVAWQWDERDVLISGALKLDPLALVTTLLVCGTGIGATLLAWRDEAARQVAHGEFFSLLLISAAGMVVLGAADDLVTAFVGLELLSLPLYILCAALLRRERSLESGLKYLIIGSVGSATLLYGFALLYGATGQTRYGAIGAELAKGDLAGDVLVLTAIGMTIVGLAFKASMAPFHQWTPDVYEGAPTPVTAFMSVATKVAAFAVIIRLFDSALIPAVDDWRPVWIAIAVISILVGNVGALGQQSLKRMLAFSSIAQAGYILVGFVVVTELGIQAVLFYLVAYLFANLAAFAVVLLRERETEHGDGLDAMRGLGVDRPLAAVAMTLSMLSLAGIPATVGFIGKFRLIEAAAGGGSTWLGIVIVIGSMISLAYYLPVVAAVWLAPATAPAGAVPATDPVTGRPALAGGAPDEERPAGGVETQVVAAVMGACILVFGIVPQPLFDVVDKVANGIVPGPLITAAARAIGVL
jgi:NADH-quinone oxidoreductase subunit N